MLIVTTTRLEEQVDQMGYTSLGWATRVNDIQVAFTNDEPTIAELKNFAKLWEKEKRNKPQKQKK